MNRIQPNHNTYTHPEAVQWLTDFMVDIKKMVLIEENYQPFTMERLNEWDTHHEDIAQCLDFHAPLSSWTGKPPLEHQNALIHFYEWIADLKVFISGVYDNKDMVFDAERIEQADKYWAEITQCKKHRQIYY